MLSAAEHVFRSSVALAKVFCMSISLRDSLILCIQPRPPFPPTCATLSFILATCLIEAGGAQCIRRSRQAVDWSSARVAMKVWRRLREKAALVA